MRVSPLPMVPPTRGRGVPDTSFYRFIALLGVAGLCLLLWAAAIPRLQDTVGQFRAASTSATVVACPATDHSTGQCRVAFTSHGTDVQAQLSRSGLAGVAVGDHVPVWFDDSGAPSVAGWRLWLDAVVLVGLALALSIRALITASRFVSHNPAAYEITPLGAAPDIDPGVARRMGPALAGARGFAAVSVLPRPGRSSLRPR